MQIIFSQKFEKQYKKAPVKIQKTFDQKLTIFMKDVKQYDLRNHRLKGILKEYCSIDVTGDWRALYSEVKSSKQLVIKFELLGTHSELYK